MRSSRRRKIPYKQNARRKVNKRMPKKKTKDPWRWTDDNVSERFLTHINEVLREKKAKRTEGWKVMPKDSCEVYKDRKDRRKHTEEKRKQDRDDKDSVSKRRSEDFSEGYDKEEKKTVTRPKKKDPPRKSRSTTKHHHHKRYRDTSKSSYTQTSARTSIVSTAKSYSSASTAATTAANTTANTVKSTVTEMDYE